MNKITAVSVYMGDHHTFVMIHRGSKVRTYNNITKGSLTQLSDACRELVFRSQGRVYPWVNGWSYAANFKEDAA